MKILVTGSSGHLGEALVNSLKTLGHDVTGMDLIPSGTTDLIGSITDRDFVKKAVPDMDHIIHTATLHKPHVASHREQLFIDTNIAGTLNLLEAAADEGIQSFVYTSTTSTFGDALVPAAGQPAAWISEDTVPVPKNIYGATKTAAEDLCQLFFRNRRLPCIVLKTSRFFPEADGDPLVAAAYDDGNVKCNEFLFRRVEIRDTVHAHLLAMGAARQLGFRKYIISATTPFTKKDLPALRVDAPAVVECYFPDYKQIYRDRGWKMFPVIDRVYDNAKARAELGWSPLFDFRHVLDRLKSGFPVESDTARMIGSKGYHRQ